jgi:hypothetical protein
MVKKHMVSSDGFYHIKGKKYQLLKGSRAQVMHNNAYQTTGELKKEDLLMNKHGRIVSRKKHNDAKKNKPLEKAGYFTKKGKFGYVKKGSKKSSTQKKRKTGKTGKKGKK